MGHSFQAVSKDWDWTKLGDDNLRGEPEGPEASCVITFRRKSLVQEGEAKEEQMSGMSS